MKNAKLIMITIPATNVDGSESFYSKLLGTDFAPALSTTEAAYHAPISSDGVDLQIGTRHSPQETPMAHFAVDDINAAVTEVKNLGGQVVWGPTALPIAPAAKADYEALVKKHNPGVAVTGNVGSAAVVRDPDGGTIGLVQLEEHTHKHFAFGKHRQPLTAEQQQILQDDVQIGKKLKKK
jgi:predicted enzyme related to lactoylglutathione lyase